MWGTYSTPSMLRCLATLRKRKQRGGATDEAKAEEKLRGREQKQRDLDKSEWEWTRGKTIPCMLGSSQRSQDDKTLNSLFFPAIISVKDKYTMYVTKTTPFWIIDCTYTLVRSRQSYTYVFLAIAII